MEKNKSSKKDIRILRLLDLIKDTDGLIDLHKNDKSESSVKGYLKLRNELVEELQSLLKEEYNITMKVEEAA